MENREETAAIAKEVTAATTDDFEFVNEVMNAIKPILDKVDGRDDKAFMFVFTEKVSETSEGTQARTAVGSGGNKKLLFNALSEGVKANDGIRSAVSQAVAANIFK